MAPKRKASEEAAAAKRAKAEAEARFKVGDECPDFEVKTHEDKTVKLSELVKDKGAVLFVYCKANTSGCTKQAQGFRDHYDEFVSAGYEVYGLSADNPKPQGNWRNKHDLPFTLLCDKSKEAIDELGFLVDDKIKRSHLVIGKGRKIEQYCFDVKPAESVDKALELCVGDEEEEEGEEDEEEEEEEAADAGGEEAGDEAVKDEEADNAEGEGEKDDE